MFVVRINPAALLAALVLAGCSGAAVTGNDTVRAQPQAGSSESLPASTLPAKGAGMVVIASQHDTAETVSRLRDAVAAKGLKVMATIDHAANAKGANMSLRPTMLVLFGNPALGTPMMQDQQTLGLDLPQRVLIYTDAAGKTWIAYNDPAWLAERHGVTGHDTELTKVAAALSGFARTAAN